MSTAEIICDSINPDGKRITTFVLKYQRFIHAEFMTHRMISKNASSSRAIPVHKIIQSVVDDPAMPIHWGREQKGMQSGTELTGELLESVKQEWLRHRDESVESAYKLVAAGLHKSLVNRILEPWHHITVVCTATEWANFFALRCHKDAQPEFQHLAELMLEKYDSHVPQEIEWNEWHLPFISQKEKNDWEQANQYNADYLLQTQLVKSSTARCARVSYLTHDGENPSLEKDVALHDRLVASKPAHSSPTEHPAMACMHKCPDHGNFKGWHQYRKQLPHENITSMDEMRELIRPLHSTVGNAE